MKQSYKLVGACFIASLLTACGGSGTPLSPSLAGVTAERTHVRPSYGVLFSFKGGTGDGAGPRAGLINVNGTLYGTTIHGGSKGCFKHQGCGTVFAITPSGTESMLYAFHGGAQSVRGTFPFAGLINAKGTFYGTTWTGGDLSCGNLGQGCGTVYAITSSGTETVLYSFKGSQNADGEYPYARLLNVNGTLYGTTSRGGVHVDCGTVFKITSSGTETVLHTFCHGAEDGISPYAGLINVHGTLYGTTFEGGRHGQGTVFSITTSGKEAVRHSFKFRGGDAGWPYAGLVNVMGTLYGTTWYGGANGNGAVFSLTKSGKEAVLHSFGGSGDGSSPYAGLINVNGTLYGTTVSGGANGDGTVFKITTSGAETVLHSFAGGSGDGASPYADLVNVNGTLYGTTYAGGTHDVGTVFSLSP